jgi:hypothetical protein
MSKLRETPRVPISYDFAGAAEAIGQSIDTIKAEVRKGNLTPRYPNSKPVILHAELVEWAESLPVNRPGAKE